MSTLKAKIARVTLRSNASSGTEDASPSTSASDSEQTTSQKSSAKAAGKNYKLLVTAGPSYDASQHRVVRVNTDDATYVENEFIRAKIKVRIRGYSGLPESSPSHSPYFDGAAHTKDQYSISFSFIPKKDLPSRDTIWGNDFDHPVRDRLPPGFNYAFRIVKEFIDQGLECDAYADEPWLYGPSLSCWFAFRIGEQVGVNADLPSTAEAQDVVKEGADGSGAAVREKLGLPTNNEKRRKFFLSAAHRDAFVFEKGRLYQVDFYNPYLDFGNIALKLPGFSINVAKYIDEKSHTLRYVFKNRATEEVYFCINMNLLWGEELRRVMEGDGRQIFTFAGAEKDGAEDDELD